MTGYLRSRLRRGSSANCRSNPCGNSVAGDVHQAWVLLPSLFVELILNKLCTKALIMIRDRLETGRYRKARGRRPIA